MPYETIRDKLKNGINETRRYSPTVLRANLREEIRELLFKIPPIYQDSILEEAKTFSIPQFRELVMETIKSLLPIPKIATIENDYLDEGEEEELKKRPASYIVPVAKPVISPAFTEALRKSISSPMEQKIIELRSEELTYKEIEPKVGLSYVYIQRLIKGDEQRFNTYYK